MHANVSDSFRKWKEVNNVEKVSEAMDNQQKSSVLKVLENLLHNGKSAQIR